MILFYRLLHHTGLVLVVFALGGVALHRFRGGHRNDLEVRRFVALVHGVGMMLLLVGGLMQAMDLGFPIWVWLKLLVWLFMGLALALAYRLPAQLAYWLTPLLALIAIGIVLYKPFY
ncbi:MAG: hypothetical protein HS115_04690 [Spirochaetales bacterium]|nr:hypothetical protein [Spirochaetales bacterium]